MSKLLMLTIVAAILALTASCDRPPAALKDATIARIPGLQLAVLVNDRTLLPFVAFAPCAAGGPDEFVSANLRMHVKISQTIDAAGGVHVTSQFQRMGGRA